MNNQIALVTGASSGIGREIAYQLASKGYNLALVARRRERLEEISEEIRKKYDLRCRPFPCDLSDREQTAGIIPEVLGWAEQEGLCLSHLINSAGATSWDSFEKQPLAQHLQEIELNIVAITTLCHQFIHHAQKNNLPSAILNISSLAALFSVENYAVYSAAKAYIVSLSESLTMELKNPNISCTCVCPGGTATEFFQNWDIDPSSAIGMMSAQKVAELSIRAMQKKKVIEVIGFYKPIVYFLQKFFPRKLALALVNRTMKSYLQKNL